MDERRAIRAVPTGLAVAGVVCLSVWLGWSPRPGDVVVRLPNQDGRPADWKSAVAAVDLKGKLVTGSGVAAEVEGAWPGFRGPNLDAISDDPTPLTRAFPGGKAVELWSVQVGDGYAGAAISKGRVYVLDYDQQAREDVLRCLSLADGKEIWRRSYGVDVARNHGMSRTVPAIDGNLVLTLGPKCHVVCADALTGEFRWGIDLVREYKTTVPQWYAGQCPLVDEGRAILAPGGEALLMAVEMASGKVLWKTPNPRTWEMTHSSVAPVTFKGRKMYVYCASKGVVGVSAEDGSLLWEVPEWKVTMATVPTPVQVGEDRIFLSGGYGAGSMMLKLSEEGGKVVARPEYRLKPEVFGAEQHTPVLYKGHLYGIIPGGQMVCLSPEGKQVWASGGKNRFGLGPYMVADGVLLVLSEKGVLTVAEASEAGYKPLALATVIEDAHEAWGPMALAGGRLIVRDMHRMVCLDLRRSSYGGQ